MPIQKINHTFQRNWNFLKSNHIKRNLTKKIFLWKKKIFLTYKILRAVFSLCNHQSVFLAIQASKNVLAALEIIRWGFSGIFFRNSNGLNLFTNFREYFCILSYSPNNMIQFFLFSKVIKENTFSSRRIWSWCTFILIKKSKLILAEFSPILVLILYKYIIRNSSNQAKFWPSKGE